MRKLLSEWLGITKNKAYLEHTIDLLKAENAHFGIRQEMSISALSLRIARLEEMMEELKRGDVNWKLAQAQTPIKTLTSFLNEIWYNIDPTKRRTS